MVDERLTGGIAEAFSFRQGPLFTYPQGRPQAAKTAVEIVEKEISANCGRGLFRPLDPVRQHARLTLAPSTERK
jgi:hypothetical protein